MGRIAGWASAALCGVAALAGAQVVEVPIDQTASSIRVELVTALGSDSDTSPLGGQIDLELDSYSAPSAITLHDFAIDVLETINLELDVFLVGRFTITGQNVSAFYATPGVPFGPVALTGPDTFTLLGVPARMTGTISYNATGLFCTFFQDAGLPCSDVIDLAEAGVVQLETLSGTLEIAGGALTVRSSGSVSQDVEGLATVNADATLVGTGEIPACRADLDGNGTLDGDDFFLFLDLFVAGDARADFEGDGDLDGDDFFLFLDEFVAGC